MISANPGRLEGGWRARGAKPVGADSGEMLVSIITVVRNGERHIEQTIRGVLSQTYPNIEYIIVDGGSADGTLGIIRKYENRIAHWVSEPDSGIYEAMNKGIRAASGEIVGIINSDDWYEPDAVAVAVKAMQGDASDYCYGSIFLVDEGGARFAVTDPVEFAEYDAKIYDEMPFGHPSAFVKRSVYLEENCFDTSFKLSADHEFFLRIHKKGRKGVNLGRVIANFRAGGASGGVESYREMRDIAIAHGKPRLAAYATYASSVVKMGLVNVLPIPVLHWLKKVRRSRHRHLAATGLRRPS